LQLQPKIDCGNDTIRNRDGGNTINTIIKIDEEKCNGCGECANACHEGAIQMINGKAKLVRSDYCDGLGACLPVCPTGAISFAEQEEAFSAEFTGSAKNEVPQELNVLPCGSPGTQAQSINVMESPITSESLAPMVSQLRQWPIQIKLAPINAPYFDNANLLVAADCTAYAYGNFHNRFIKNSITLIGCPKLDTGSYADKLTEILKHNNIKKVTVVRMEVPCCGGIENAVREALSRCGKLMPWQVITIQINGNIVEG